MSFIIGDGIGLLIWQLISFLINVLNIYCTII